MLGCFCLAKIFERRGLIWRIEEIGGEDAYWKLIEDVNKEKYVISKYFKDEIEKYEIIMENEAIKDYESVALRLEEELSEVYKEIN